MVLIFAPMQLDTKVAVTKLYHLSIMAIGEVQLTVYHTSKPLNS